MRANSWHHPSKGKALWLAIVYGVVAIALYWLASATTFGFCGFTGTIAILVSVAYLVVFVVKVSEDSDTAKREIAQRYVQAEHYAVPAPKTTPGNRFFMPGQPDSGDRAEG